MASLANRSRSPIGGGRVSNPKPSGNTNGTMGGQTRQTKAAQGAAGSMAGLNAPTFYLWILVAIEVFLIGYFRHTLRRYHGG